MKSTEFKKIVSKEFAPFLRENGWKGSGFKYYKQSGNIFQLLNFQASRYGGEFCINLGVHFDFLTLEKDIKKINSWDEGIWKRLSPKGMEDCWWTFPENETQKNNLFNELKTLFQTEGNSYFKKFVNWKEIITKFSINDIQTQKTNYIFNNKTEIGTAMFLARINEYLENPDKVIEFSEYGLSEVKGNLGSLLVPEFKKLIKTAGNNVYK